VDLGAAVLGQLPVVFGGAAFGAPLPVMFGQ